MAPAIALSRPSALSPISQGALFTTFAVALILGLWWGTASLRFLPVNLLPGPMQVLRAGWDQLAGGDLLASTGISLARLCMGFAIGAATGVLAGIAMGIISMVRTALLPLVEVLRAIPPLAWIPLAIIWCGIGEGSKLFLIALTAFFPIAVATLRGVEQVDPVLLRAARSLDVPPRRMMTSVLFPAAMPDIATGLRLGWTLSFAILVGAEMIAARSGLGYMLMGGMNLGRYDIVLFGILFLGLLSVATDALLMGVIRRYLLHWHSGIERARQ